MINYDTKLDSVGENLLHNDANDIGFFEQQLEQILAKTYDILYPALKGTTLVPIDTSLSNGAETFAYFVYDSVGITKVISDYADDLPSIDLTGKKEVGRIRSIGNKFGYSVQEIRAAQTAGIPLEQRKANASRLSFEQKTNQVIWNGDEAYNLDGFLTSPNIPKSDVPNDGTSSSTQFEDKTPKQILRDLNAAVSEVIKTTKAVHYPDTLILPVDQHEYISSTPMSDLNQKTILQTFLGNRPGIKVDWVNELEGAGTLGVDVMIAYENNADRISFMIPQEYETFPPQAKNLKINIPTHGRLGGFVAYYPLSANIKEGI